MTFLSRGIARVHRKYQYLRSDIRHLAGLDKHLFANAAAGCRIITYHGICLEHPTRFNASFLTRETFGQQLQLYKEHFNMISLEDYYAGNFSQERFNCCITFDDGHRNNLNYALPLLEQYGIPATFFITGIRKMGYDILWNDFLALFSKYGPKKLIYKGAIFHKNKWNRYIAATTGESLADRIRKGGFDLKVEMMELLETVLDFRSNKKEEDFWLQMTVEEIAQLAASPLVTIGAHGLTHNDLALLDKDAAAKELSGCKQFLEATTGKTISALAFPYGSYNPGLKTMAREAGFDRLLALDFLSPKEDSGDATMRERLVMNPYISVNNQLQAIISGKYY